MFVIEIPAGEKKENRAEKKILEEIMTGNFLYLLKT